MARAITVQAGPFVVASANNIATSQAVQSKTPVVLNGTLGTSVVNNIATSQVVTGAGNVVLNGSLASGSPAVAFINANLPIFITSAGNDSAITFTVTGTFFAGVPGVGLVSQTESFLGGNTATGGVVSSSKKYYTITSIATSGTTSSIQVGTYNIATTDTARRIAIASAGNDSGITFAISGTNWAGDKISESLTGGNIATVSSVLDYATITSIIPSGATASTITVGTSSTVSGGSPWVRLDEWAAMGPTALQINGSGTINWTVQQTLDDPNAVQTNVVAVASMTWINHPDSNLVGSTSVAGVQGNYAYPPKFVRIVANSNTNPALVTLTVMQNYQK